MLGANESITLWRKAGRDAATRGNLHERFVYDRAHWFSRAAAQRGGNGYTPSCTCVVRIAHDGILSAAPGDVIARGAWDAQNPQQAESAGAVCRTVVSITDNRCGAPTQQHWKLEAE